MLPLNVVTTKMENFRAPTTRILFGDRLKEVQQIQASIQTHGLLNPLVVMKRGAKLIVIDGKKRLTALRRMKFAGTLPRSLINIPYILVDKVNSEHMSPMSLLSNGEKYEEAMELRQRGHSLMEIATALYVSKQCIKDLLCISRLSPRLRQAFFGGTISTEQAIAFSTLPNLDAQDNLLIALGPFANAPDILNAIKSGQTVIDMGDDNVIILPSRPKAESMPLAA